MFIIRFYTWSGTGSKNSLTQWIKQLEEENPHLSHVPVVFRLRSPETGLQVRFSEYLMVSGLAWVYGIWLTQWEFVTPQRGLIAICMHTVVLQFNISVYILLVFCVGYRGGSHEPTRPTNTGGGRSGAASGAGGRRHGVMRAHRCSPALTRTYKAAMRHAGTMPPMSRPQTVLQLFVNWLLWIMILRIYYGLLLMLPTVPSDVLE